jgi:L-alanine-DL-glutamate epimerase-like enolase superfamily enzyme
VQVVPHGWNTAIGLPADLWFSEAIPVACYAEYLMSCAYIDEIVTEPFRLDEQGLLDIPTWPGLGVEIDSDKLIRSSPERVDFQ